MAEPGPHAAATAAPAAPAGAKAAPPRTSAFKVPGEGSSLAISIVTIAALLLAWTVVTHAGWIKPLFLPSPQAVGQQFWEYLTGAANDKPLWQHFVASVGRVFAAFARRCSRRCPWASPWG